MQCLNLYKTSLPLGSGLESTDNQPGDDACLLAVMGLVHMANKEGDASQKAWKPIRLLQALSLLDFLLSRSKHNYQALLIIVQLYVRIGAGSLAFTTYSRLSIKQIQHDTMSHILLTRVSTLHPHTITTMAGGDYVAKDLDPAIHLSEAVSIYPKTHVDVRVQIRKAIEAGNYAQVARFWDFDIRQFNSICKHMWHVEGRRIERLYSPGSGYSRFRIHCRHPGLSSENVHHR